MESNSKNNRVETLFGIVGIIIATILGFGLVPGFLFASIIDCFTILKQGPIWSITILVTVSMLFFSLES
ncbi:MAG: hypothetical protein IPK08_17175 [Bacteroidetes bacterium]|nr:hypothetical protein [Bacteroidota bacterium]